MALAGALDLRHLDPAFAQTNRLRTEGTDHLLSTARAAGVKRFVAQSFAGWPFKRIGGPVKTEEDPLEPNPPDAVREILGAIFHPDPRRRRRRRDGGRARARRARDLSGRR